MRTDAVLITLILLTVSSIIPPFTRVTPSSEHSQFFLSSSNIGFEMSTFFGGDREDTGSDVQFDNEGNIIIVGSTRSANLTVINAQQSTYGGVRDVFILKLDSSYNVVFCTYYGGSGEEYPMALVTDDDSNIIIVGHTESDNLAVPNGLQTEMQGNGDAFVAKFDPSGELIYGTYIGGNGADEWLNAVILDANENLILAGPFDANDMNTTPNAFQEDYAGGSTDLIVLSLTPDGQNVNFMTYFGLDIHENCAGITLDSQNNIIITGYTDSNGITTEGAYQETYAGGDSDAFVAKLSSNGQTLLWSTLLGGNAWDFGADVSIDADDNVIVSGYSESSNFPLQNELFSDDALSDTFLAKLSHDGSELLFSTLLGGNSDDRCYGMLPLSNGSIATCSMTQSTNMPTVRPWQENTSGSYDVYFALYANDMDSLVCASYIGGSGNDHGYSLDIFNDEYIALVGYTSSDDFPTKNPLQSARAGNRDAFVIVLNLNPVETPTTTPPPDQFPLELIIIGLAILIGAVVIIVYIYVKKKS
jgi:hypothetical protein